MQRGVEHIELAIGRGQIGVAHFGIGRRRVKHLGHDHATVGPHRAEIGVVGEIRERLARADAAKTLQALPDIGLEADARLLAIVDDVDAGRDLLLHAVFDPGLG